MTKTVPLTVANEQRRPRSGWLPRSAAVLFGSPRLHPIEFRLFNALALINGAANLVGAFAHWHHAHGPALFLIHFLSGGFLLLLYYLSRRWRQYGRLYWPFVLSILLFLGVNVLLDGGSRGGSHYYLAATSVIAVILAKGHIKSAVAVALTLVVTAAMFMAEYRHPEWFGGVGTLSGGWADRFGNFIFVQLLIAVLVSLLVSNLEVERRKADLLLLNVLPGSVADELKKYERAAPQSIPVATVLFADIVGFTASAESTSPDDLVADLDEVFRAFDGVMAKWDLEKIKTIGDAYMAVSGAPIANDRHAADAVNAALDMCRAMDRINEGRTRAGKGPWPVRIGLHCGPLTAGVIGTQKFAYDLWGDTVNVASRMESGGLPGRINVSREIFDRTQFDFVYESRGTLPVKNRGQMEMFLVVSKAPAPHTEAM